MMMNKDTRTAILDAAQDLVQRQSISGVSFQSVQVLRRVVCTTTLNLKMI